MLFLLISTGLEIFFHKVEHMVSILPLFSGIPELVHALYRDLH